MAVRTCCDYPPGLTVPSRVPFTYVLQAWFPCIGVRDNLKRGVSRLPLQIVYFRLALSAKIILRFCCLTIVVFRILVLPSICIGALKIFLSVVAVL